ncbi:glycosyl transferase [Nonlabens spongiae]|uniref:Glycosyl transferase n=1 Tax=Nonlabens spongiae TaxID=331648 RepID=A0A1W6MJ79_9FLAO|nr:glycosyltransferase family 2 protein [Nonlabens spongiae]ARN77650.1 glycosyl transferase [Nonlabens spongiae]
MTSALVVTTYNWPEALSIQLKSIERLTKLPDQVIIADDGSGKETLEVIEQFKSKSDLNVKHVWHEDRGFRRSAILNKAIAQCDADYIIQSDGDCILHHSFVDDHLRHSAANTYLHGSRVNIQKELADKILESQQYNLNVFSQGIKKRMRALHLPVLSTMNKAEQFLSKKIRGCNLSYWRKDFLNVNGYNEDIEGWGKEDSELILRMLNSGVSGKRLKFAAIVFHLWHKEQDKSGVEANIRLEEKTRNENISWIENGVAKYL